MKPPAQAFTVRTVGAFSELLGLARERLAAAVSHVEADDPAGAADELRAAAELAVQAWGGARSLADAIDAQAARP